MQISILGVECYDRSGSGALLALEDLIARRNSEKLIGSLSA